MLQQDIGFVDGPGRREAEDVTAKREGRGSFESPRSLATG